MTLHVDYTQLAQPPLRLSLESEGRNYIVCHNDTVYMRSPNLQTCLRFLKTGADKGDWLIDDQSVERATWHSASGGVPEREQPRSPVTLSAPHGETATPPETFSRAVLADVIPINRRSA